MDVPERECPACHATVPAETFCGDCGIDLRMPVSAWGVLARAEVYAAAPNEAVWSPWVSSTLFPHIPAVSRKPFRLGLGLILVAIVALTEAGLNGPLGVVSVIGWPLMFLIYVWQSDGFREIPLRILTVAMLLGVGLGVGWWLWAGKLIAGSFGVSTGSSLRLLHEVLNIGLFISLGGGALLVLPALVARAFRMPVRESLDGFVVGAFGALWCSTAATTTILAPQFAEGLMEDHSAGRLFEDSITYGVVNAIVTTAVGGLVGLSLWFTPDRRPGHDPKRARKALAVCTLLAAVLYAAVWVVDSFGWPRILDLTAKVMVAALALITVRFAVQIALLHETPDPATGTPLLCVHCTRVVPDMPFCVACGAAARASSRSSRRLRRQSPPQCVESSY